MYYAEPVVGKGLHIIVYDPVYDEYGETQYELARGSRGEIKAAEETRQKYLVGLEAYKKVRYKKIYSRNYRYNKQVFYHRRRPGRDYRIEIGIIFQSLTGRFYPTKQSSRHSLCWGLYNGEACGDASAFSRWHSEM